MGDGKEKKEIVILRITKKEKDHARAQADGAGLSISGLIRAQLSGTHIRTKADVDVLNELRKLGGMCMYLFNNGADPARTSAALRELEQAATRLFRK